MTIRIIHHWACSGGTVISRAIATLPQVVFLSEIHPFAHLRHNTAGSNYAPTDIIMQLSLPHNGRDPVLCDAVWRSSIDALVRELAREKKHLVIRSHSHIDFFLGASTVKQPFVSHSLAPHHRLLEVVSVRHPLDSWISIQAQNWHHHFRFSGLGEFCKRALDLLDACNNFLILRYEDFTLAPLDYLHKLSSFWEIPLKNHHTGTDRLVLDPISLSGDSGRRSNTIAPRERRLISQSVDAELENQLAMPYGESPYQILCMRLGYDPSAKASHPFTLKELTVPNLMLPLSMTDDMSNLSLDESFSTPYDEELGDLKRQLLRNEQKYFEQLDRQAAELEQLNSDLSGAKESIRKSDLIRLQLRQAREELELIYQSLDSTEQQLQIRSLQLQQAERQLQIQSLQLQQAQEELSLNADHLQYLQNWRHQILYSGKNQLKLVFNTIVIRIVEHARWVVPNGFLRSHKLRIKNFLRN